MRLIEKKVWPDYFESLLAGEKKFEVRIDDFEVEVGDVLRLREYSPGQKKGGYTSRELFKKVAFIFYTKEIFNSKPGFVVLGLDDTWKYS